jgi:hypothetical protein
MNAGRSRHEEIALNRISKRECWCWSTGIYAKNVVNHSHPNMEASADHSVLPHATKEMKGANAIGAEDLIRDTRQSGTVNGSR